jgi:putative addiction module component (TIGR02574 family)
MTPTQQILSLALSLPVSERASLAQQILQSLDAGPFDESCAAAWKAELVKRLDEADQGLIDEQDWQEVIEEMRRSLSQERSS